MTLSGREPTFGMDRFPTPHEIIEACGEPHMTITQDAVEALFCYDPTSDDLAAFKVGFWEGSRSGLVELFELARQAHDEENEHLVFACLCAWIWTEGKQTTVLAEYGLDCQPQDLLRVISWFALSGTIMSNQDLAAHKSLDEVVTVWRGGSQPAHELKMGHSWSTDRSIAQWFAQRSSDNTGRPPVVIRRRVNKSELIAYFTGRDEAEAVLWPSGYARRSFRRRLAPGS